MMFDVIDFLRYFMVAILLLSLTGFMIGLMVVGCKYVWEEIDVYNHSND